MQGPSGWRLLSQRIRAELESRGVEAHEHKPLATHLHSREEYLSDVANEIRLRMQRLAERDVAMDRHQLFAAAVRELWGPPPHHVQDLYNVAALVLTGRQ